MSYIVLDLEFNQAFDFKNNRTVNVVPSCRFEIFQIGAIKLDENFNIVDKLNLLIKPNLYKIMHPHVKKLTHFSEKDLKDKPSFIDVFDKFKNFIDFNKDPIFCVWGTGDLRALYRNLAYYNMLNSDLILKYLDVQTITSNFLGYPKGTTIGLKNATEHFNLSTDISFHNALNDALYTAYIFEKVYNDNLQIKIFNSKNVPEK